MAESTLSISQTTLKQETAFYLGWGRDSTLWTSDESARLTSLITQALRKFYVPEPTPLYPTGHQWSFLKPTATFTVWPSYAVSSSRLVNTVGTAVTNNTGSTFYETMVGKTITINGTDYTISAYVSATAITLSSTAGNQTGVQWAITADGNYRLPDNFGGLDGPLTFTTDDYGCAMNITSESRIRLLRNTSEYTGQPNVAATRPLTTDQTTGQRWDLMLYPTPDAVYSLYGRMIVLPNTLGSAEYPYGGEHHANTMLQACLATAEERENGGRGPQYAAWISALNASIGIDRSATMPENFGYNGNGKRGNAFDPYAYSRYVTVNGVLPT